MKMCKISLTKTALKKSAVFYFCEHIYSLLSPLWIFHVISDLHTLFLIILVLKFLNSKLVTFLNL